MAAVLAGQAAGELGGKLFDEAEKTVRAFEENPVKTLGKLCRLVGAASAIAGGLSYVFSISTARLEQQYKNDIDNRLGLPNGPPPTPPSAKQIAAQDQALTPDVQAISVAAGSVWNISLSNAQVSGQKMLDAMNAMATELANLKKNGGSDAAISGASDAVSNFSLAAQQFDYIPPGTTVTVAPTNPDWPPTTTTYEVWTYVPGGVSGGGPYWSAAEDWVWLASNAVNQLAAALNIPVPFNVPATPPGSPPPPKPTSASGPLAWIGGFFTAAGAALTNASGDVVAAAETVGGWIGQAAADAQAFGSDVGAGIAFLGRMLLNLPILVWDGLGYAVSWGANTFFADVWQPLLIFGAALLGISFLCLELYPKLRSRAALQVAKLEKKITDATMGPAETDRTIREVAREEVREGQIAAVTQPEPPPSTLSEALAAAPVAPEPASPNSASQDASSPTAPPATPETSVETPPLNAPSPLPMGTPTSEVEAQLGDQHIAPTADEVRAMIEEAEKNRLATMPAPRPRKPKPRGRDWAKAASDAFAAEA